MSGAENRFLDKDKISAALKFWELGRIPFNLILLALFFWLGGAPVLLQSRVAGAAFVLVMAAAANILYCLAYPVDLLLQHSHWRGGWLRVGRYALWLSGMLIASALEYLAVFGMMMSVPGAGMN